MDEFKIENLPAASQQPPEAIQPGPGKLPVRPGTAVLTEHARQQLEALGWKDGDPIPGDLGKRISKAMEQARQEIAADQAAATEKMIADGRNKPKTIVSTTDISKLPPEKQEEIRRYLAEYKQQTELAAAAQANRTAAQKVADRLQASGADPSVVAAARTAAGSIPSTAAPLPAAPPGFSTGGIIGDLDAQQKMEGLKAAYEAMQAHERASPPPESPPPPPEPPPAETASQPTHCSRCFHSLSDSPPEFSAEDKEMWLAMFLGEQPFRKQMSAIGGAMTVYFRTLTAAEETMLYAQMGKFVLQRKVFGEIDYAAALLDLKFAFSLERIDKGGHASYEAPTLDEIKTRFAPPPAPPDTPDYLIDTPLVGFREHLLTNVIKHEAVRRHLATLHRDFGRLASELEAAALHPDFCKGIALPGSWLKLQPKG